MRIVWLFPIIGMVLVAPAQAAPIVLQDQHVAYGIRDVLVDEVLYDVTFRFETLHQRVERFTATRRNEGSNLQ